MASDIVSELTEIGITVAVVGAAFWAIQHFKHGTLSAGPLTVGPGVRPDPGYVALATAASQAPLAGLVPTTSFGPFDVGHISANPNVVDMRVFS